MSTLIALVLGIVAILLAVPVAVLALQTLVAFARRVPAPLPPGVRPRLAVLIPAHNESSGVTPTLKAVRSQLLDGDRCVVVADNCSDDTASVAAAAGAEVLERHDIDRRGKGYALDFGLRFLDADPPDVLVVVDADCLLTDGCLDRIGRLSLATRRPVQAVYLMTAPAPAKRSTQIAEFAFRVKNLARPMGFLRLGLPCQLMGTGMAFPWPVLRSIDLATGHIVEDLKMGLDLAAAGHPPLFCPDALVTSQFPVNEAGTKSQRKRWEHGHLSMIVGTAPGLLWHSLRTRDVASFALGLDLLVPPLALLVMASTLFAMLCLAFLAVGGSAWPLLVSLIGLGGLFVAVALAWLRYGRDVLPLATLALAPLYALKKIPLYLRFVVSRQAEWVRSKRDAP